MTTFADLNLTETQIRLLNENAARALSTKDLRSAIAMGEINIGGMRPEFRADLQNRIDVFRAELSTRRR
jgi:hypothetical protein